MDGPRLSLIGIKPGGFYFIARIPNYKMKQKKLKKNSEYCTNFENKERVKMAHPGFPVLKRPGEYTGDFILSRQDFMESFIPSVLFSFFK